MTRFTVAVLAAFSTVGAASAGGLDRSGQSVLAIFDDPGTLSFGLSHVTPDLTGTDVRGTGSYDAGGSYTQYSFSYSNQINDRFSYAIIGDQPFGADIFYNDTPQTSALGGTKADLSSDAVSFIGKYQLSDRVSVFGGLRAERAGGTVALNGQAYAQAISVSSVARGAGVGFATLGAALQGDPTAVAAVGGPANAQALGAQVQALSTQFLTPGVGGFTGYDVEIEQSWGVGVTLGAAYEIPEIALRLAVTYHSEVTHEGDATERFGFTAAGAGAPIPGRIAFQSPQSVNIDFQTGINPKTLLLASMRWTDWDDFDVIPTQLGSDLANIDDSYRWTLGVARRFSDELVGLASITYEKDNGGATLSPLGPTDGQIGVSVGARYSTGNLDISGGINYTKVGSAFAGVGGQPVASFTDNSAIGVGFKVAYKF
ncbi:MULTISPECIES: OmpP1/FadL family transporter [Jannaschia]|nr:MULTISPECIES: outer membrane protein transport protein [unclassified Jannaschia]